MKRLLVRYSLPLCLLLSGCSTLNSNHSHTEYTDPKDDFYQDSRVARDAGTLEAEPAEFRADAPTRDEDFWQQVRTGLQLDGTGHIAVQRQLTEYRRNSTQVEKVFQRGSPYLGYIHDEVKRRGFPAEITLLPFIESSYDPFAYSHGRAAGLWQFIPGTARLYGLRQDWWYDGRRDVIASTRAALDYLDRLQKQFDGDWLLALAAYNAGEGTVGRAIRKNQQAGKPADFWHLDLPGETEAYVPRLLAVSAIVAKPSRYGIRLDPVETQAAFEVVNTGGQLDLAVAAELAGMEMDELYRFNPGFNRWATHPDGPHRLAVPTDRAEEFRSNLAALPDSKRVKWVRHKISKGETLSHIASRYSTTVGVLRNSNNLDGSSAIVTGRHLLVPVAAKQAVNYAAVAERLQPGRSSASKQKYRVRDGDSLWSIARKHKVSIQQLTRWNRLDSGALIKPGQQLVIWQQPTTTSSSPARTLRTVHYQVRNGDSLYRIAQKFNVSISELRRWNNLSSRKHLQPGQKLKLYVDVTRLAGNIQG